MFAEGGGERAYLLLKRVEGQGGFWQPVTGSLEDAETHAQAAVREVFEETAILAREEQLVDLRGTNNFEIAPAWQPRYAPGVTHNEEVCFALRVEEGDIKIDPSEHSEYAWVDYETAFRTLHWESNKRAFAVVDKLVDQAYP